MTITRRALLISNPGEPGESNYCKGVLVDIANYKAYLSQAFGGAWDDNQIVHLQRPSLVDVRAAVQDLRRYSYSFVAFSGHGWYSSVEKATVLTFRRNQEMAYHELLADANKRTLVLDCCREIYHERVTLHELRIMKNALAGRRIPNAERCRDAFFSVVSSATEGVIVAHSCRAGETSGDDETQGGRYTANLLAVAREWAESVSQQSYDTQPKNSSVVACHDVAAVQTVRRSGDTQNPSIDKPRTSRPYFPFAVFAD